MTQSGDLDGITVYHYNGHQMIEPRDGSGNVVTQVYHGTRYIDEVVSMRTEYGRVYLHQAERDQGGSVKDYNVTGLTDITGRVLERYYYSPYGALEVVVDAHPFDYDDDGDVDSAAPPAGGRALGGCQTNIGSGVFKGAGHGRHRESSLAEGGQPGRRGSHGFRCPALAQLCLFSATVLTACSSNCPAPAVIYDYFPTYSLSVRLLNETGEPASGASVRYTLLTAQGPVESGSGIYPLVDMGDGTYQGDYFVGEEAYDGSSLALVTRVEMEIEWNGISTEENIAVDASMVTITRAGVHHWIDLGQVVIAEQPQARQEVRQHQENVTHALDEQRSLAPADQNGERPVAGRSTWA